MNQQLQRLLSRFLRSHGASRFIFRLGIPPSSSLIPSLLLLPPLHPDPKYSLVPGQTLPDVDFMRLRIPLPRPLARHGAKTI